MLVLTRLSVGENEVDDDDDGRRCGRHGRQRGGRSHKAAFASRYCTSRHALGTESAGDPETANLCVKAYPTEPPIKRFISMPTPMLPNTGYIGPGSAMQRRRDQLAQLRDSSQSDNGTCPGPSSRDTHTPSAAATSEIPGERSAYASMRRIDESSSRMVD